MKKNILLFAFVFSTTFSIAQSGAKIEFKEKENTIDFGVIVKDVDNGVRSFVFTNTGNAPLIISNVQSTNGCIILSKPTEPIAVGKSGKIEIKYNMNVGSFRKTITVESNAVNYEEGKIALKIKGEVVLKK